MHGTLRIFFSIVIVLSLMAVTPASARMALVEGSCTLEGEIDHSGTKLVFTATTPTAVTDSTTTDLTGHYQIGLAEGEYQVTMSHPGFLTHVVTGLLFAGEGYILDPVTLAAGTMVEVSGQVSGDWPGDTHYMVVGDLHVAAGDSLLIHPGASVLFTGYFEILVEGSLTAAGAASDSVVFASALPNPAPSDWNSLHILGAESRLSLQYCIIEHAQIGAYVEGSNSDAFIIQQSTIRYCNWGMSVYGEGVEVTNNIFADNSLKGIFDRASGSRYIDNTFYSNSTNLELYESSGTLIEGNVIVGDIRGISFRFGPDQVVIRKNTIVGCRYGIFFQESSDNFTIEGNTIVGSIDYGIYAYGGSSYSLIRHNVIVNSASWGLNCNSSQVSVGFNNFWGNAGGNVNGGPPGIGELITTNANGDSCDTYFNISLDPEFVDEISYDYNLLPTSPCIDAGDPDEAYYDPDGTIADLGALPFYQTPLLPPVIDLMAAPLSGFSPLAVEFTSLNTGGPILEYLWDFGDGSTSGQAHPVHVFTTQVPSTYTVSLTVTGPGAVQDAVSYPDLISLQPASYPPISEFSADPLVGYGSVQFTNMSVGVIDSLRWNFGDGETSAEVNPEHDYAIPGIYTVFLIAYGPGGIDVETKTDYIEILVPDAIVASFEPSTISGVVPATIIFTNTTIGTVEGYHWAFGDGNTSIVEHPVHQYSESGSFEVIMIATGPASADTARATIEILDPEPVITAINDVPDDQGGLVRVTIKRSGHDFPDETENPIANYNVWRKVADKALIQELSGIGKAAVPAGNLPRMLYRESDFVVSDPEMITLGFPAGTWEVIGNFSAIQQDQYIFPAPTLVDSTVEDPGYSYFCVTAHTTTPSIWFASAPDSGYSVDNIAPGAPISFSAAYLAGGVILEWDDAPEVDFQFYRIYRDTDPGFTPSQNNLIHETATSAWTDPTANPWGYYYKVTVLDHAGNEGEAGSPSDVTGVQNGTVPTRTALLGAVPNPFNPSTKLSFDIAAAGHVRLKVYDPAGRLITILVDGHREAGSHDVIWYGQDEKGRMSSAGVYLYRLEVGNYFETKRMTLVK